MFIQAQGRRLEFMFIHVLAYVPKLMIKEQRVKFKHSLTVSALVVSYMNFIVF